MKRTATAKQLRALAKGRKIRKSNIRRGKRKGNPRRYIRRRPMKRRRTDTLTGGSGDVNPQLFSGKITTIANDTPISNAYLNPISRLPKTGTKVAVMEVLKVYVWLPDTLVTGAVETTYMATINFGTKDFGTSNLVRAGEPTVFALLTVLRNGAFTVGGTYSVAAVPLPVTMDLTDGIGHGILVASDYIYVQLDTAGHGGLASAYFKILYRIKNVALTEYIGIVQSQQ